MTSLSAPDTLSTVPTSADSILAPTLVDLSTYKFTKAQRLLTPTAYRLVFDGTERKLHQAHLMAFIRSNEQSLARIGMAITKKKVPTAVQRNRIKRHIREQFRHCAAQLKSYDIVFIVKKPINDLDNKELDNEIKAIFKKLKKNNK
jgi:ribonuclease P protein component